MKRQTDLDKYNPDLQWERMQDKLMTALCIIVLMLVAAFAYQGWLLANVA
ncbi:MAG: hypothetical protein LIP16_03200 [Clostridium sp.]|nr:hypothetical protein [Clostridium sp.]